MEAGLLEKILRRRYGQPVVGIRRGLHARCWNPDEFDYSTVLYIGMEWSGAASARFASLQGIYGDSLGGFLIKNTIKIAALVPRDIYGVWNIDELRALPQLQHAIALDPDVDYFMDEHNVLFYGAKRGDLYVFDSQTDELDCLGPVEQALETVLADWEAVMNE